MCTSSSAQLVCFTRIVACHQCGIVHCIEDKNTYFDCVWVTVKCALFMAQVHMPLPLSALPHSCDNSTDKYGKRKLFSGKLSILSHSMAIYTRSMNNHTPPQALTMASQGYQEHCRHEQKQSKHKVKPAKCNSSADENRINSSRLHYQQCMVILQCSSYSVQLTVVCIIIYYCIPDRVTLPTWRIILLQQFEPDQLRKTITEGFTSYVYSNPYKVCGTSLRVTQNV